MHPVFLSTVFLSLTSTLSLAATIPAEFQARDTFTKRGSFTHDGTCKSFYKTDQGEAFLDKVFADAVALAGSCKDIPTSDARYKAWFKDDSQSTVVKKWLDEAWSYGLPDFDGSLTLTCSDPIDRCNNGEKVGAYTETQNGIIHFCPRFWDQARLLDNIVPTKKYNTLLESVRSSGMVFFHELLHAISKGEVTDVYRSDSNGDASTVRAYGHKLTLKLAQENGGAAAASLNADSYAFFCTATYFSKTSWPLDVSRKDFGTPRDREELK